MYDINKVREDLPIPRIGLVSRFTFDTWCYHAVTALVCWMPCVESILIVNVNVHRGVHWCRNRQRTYTRRHAETMRKFIKCRAHYGDCLLRVERRRVRNPLPPALPEGCMQAGNEVDCLTMEHHSNIVPWQFFVKKSKGIVLKAIPTDDGILDPQVYEQPSPNVQWTSV